MELFWLWLPVLGSALMAGSGVTSRPVDQDHLKMSPEDEQLAEVCGQMITILMKLFIFGAYYFEKVFWT